MSPDASVDVPHASLFSPSGFPVSPVHLWGLVHDHNANLNSENVGSANTQ